MTIKTENRLREASPDRVYQDAVFLDVGGLNNSRYRDIISIDVKSTEEITKATLSLCWYYPEGSSRSEDTVIEVYRPASWNPDYVSWNKRDKDVAWTNPGGDWYDKNGVLQGSTPYATLTIKGSTLPDNRYYALDVTELVKEYVSGKYENTGFLIKAKDEIENYIAFDSSKSDTNRPLLTIENKTSTSSKTTWLIIPCKSEDEAESVKKQLGGMALNIEFYIQVQQGVGNV